MKFELSHDSLAQQVFDKASTEARTRRKVERYVRERYAAYQERGARLTQDDVDFVTPYLGVVNISAEELAFVKQGRLALQRARRKVWLLIIGIIAVLLGLTTWAIINSQLAEKHATEAEANAAKAAASAEEAFTAKRQDSLRAIDLGIALKTADAATLRATAAQKTDSLKAIELGLALNDANLQRLAAERRTLEAEALALITKATALAEKDWYTAMRVAHAAWERAAPLPPAEVALGLSDIFYQRYAEPSPIWKPLPAANFGHRDHVNSAVFSPDGQYILTASLDSTATLWDRKGKVISRFMGHRHRVNSAVFSPNGHKVLTCSSDKTAKLWSLSGKLITSFIGHKSRVRSVDFSSDGQHILTSSGDDTAILWDLNGKPITTFSGHKGYLTSAVFSPNGQCILTSSSDGTAILWDQNGNIITTFDHGSNVSAATFSPDGTHVLTSGEIRADGSDEWIGSTLWDLQGNQIADYPQNATQIYSAALSPDGQRVLTSSTFSGVELWSVDGKRIATAFSGHSGIVWSAVFSPDEQHFLTASEDGTAKLWDLERNQIATFRGHSGKIWSAVFSPDGQYILTRSGDKTAKLWPINKNIIADFLGHKDRIESATFSPDGQYLLTASKDSTAKIWDLNGHVVSTIEAKGILRSAKFSPDGEHILTFSGHHYVNTANLWNRKGQLLKTFFEDSPTGQISASFSPDGKFLYLNSWHELWAIKGDQATKLDGSINSVEYSPGGQHILTTSYGLGPAQLRNQNYELVTNLDLDRCFNAVFSPDSQRIFALHRNSDDDKTASWLSLDGQLLQSFEWSQRYYDRSTIFSPNGQHLIVFGSDWTGQETAKLLTHEGQLITTFVKPEDEDFSTTFSPNGRYLLHATGANAQLWSVQGELITEFRGHSSEIESAIFSPNGHYVLTASKYYGDKTAKLWDLDGQLIANLVHSDYVESAIFSPDGRFIFTTTRKTAKLWPTPQRIYDYLKNEAGIPELTKEQRRLYGIY